MGFFNTAPDSALIDQNKIDTAYNRSNQYSNISQDFLDPNNQFYKKAASGFQRNQFDLQSAGIRQRQGQFASQGINSNSLMGTLYQDAARRSSDAASQFQSSLLGQGLNAAQGFAGIGSQYYGQGMQGDMSNAQANAAWQNSWMGVGGSLLGGALGDGGLSDFLGGAGNFLGGLFQGGSSNSNNNNPNDIIDYSNDQFG